MWEGETGVCVFSLHEFYGVHNPFPCHPIGADGAMGGGDSSVECWTCDWKVAGLNPCRNSRRIFFSRVNFLCWLLFRYPFHPHVTAVARKRSRSFCQKCRWQVTAKHAHGAQLYLYDVHRTCARGSSFMWHQYFAVSTPLRWIFKNTLQKASHSCRTICEQSQFAWEWRIALYKQPAINSFSKRVSQTG